MRRRILPILKTRTTRSSVGDTGKSAMRSSITMPTMEAITSTKSNRFQAVEVVVPQSDDLDGGLCKN